MSVERPDWENPSAEVELPVDKRFEAMRRNGKKLVYGADFLRVTGHHYDKKNPVQVSAMGWYFDSRFKHHEIPGSANFTPYRGADKDCAELGMIALAKALGVRIHAFAISGPERQDQTSKLESPVLDPCGRCRDVMAGIITDADEPIKVITPSTIVISHNAEREIYGFQTVDELLGRHNPALSATVPPRILGPDFYTALDDFGYVHRCIVDGTAPDLREQIQDAPED